jgi:colanic acid biosynthesis glycosyl transferase WcaI
VCDLQLRRGVVVNARVPSRLPGARKPLAQYMPLSRPEDYTRRHPPPYDRVRRDERIAPDPATSEDDTSRRQPDAVLDDDRPRLQGHVAAKCVRAGGDEGALRNDDVGPDVDLSLIVNPDSFADPAAVTDAELPREPDSKARSQQHPFTDLRAEGAQDASPNTRADLPWISNEQQLANRPQVHDGRRAIPGRPLSRRGRQIDGAIVIEVHARSVRSEVRRARADTTSRRVGLHLALPTDHNRSVRRTSMPGRPQQERRSQVLIIGLNYAPEPTGSAPYTAGLAEMIARFADVDVLAGVPHYPAWRVEPAYRWRLHLHEKRNGVDVHHFRHFVPGRQSALGRALWDASYVLNASLYRPRRKPDLVIASTPSLGGAVLGAEYARRCGVPLALVVQDLVGQAAKQSGISGGARVAHLVATVERWAIARADVVAIVSERFRDQLAIYGIDESKIRLFPNWTHIAEPTVAREAVRSEFGWSDDVFVALHAGNMGLKQGLGNIVEAARALTRRTDVRFVLCGDGNQRATLQDQARGLANVEFLDPVSDERYPDLLRAADVLLVNERPTVGDMALPSKLTSYFAAGRAVLAAVSLDGACAHEIAKTQGAARIVAPGEPGTLAQAVEELASDAEAAAAMARAGVRFAQDHLGSAAAANRARELVDDLLRSGT